MAPVTATATSHSADMSDVLESTPNKKTRHPTAHRNLKRESRRLKTFENWPVSFISRYDLAKNGFYFTNIDDVVKCAFCKTQIGLWEEKDDPRADHLKFSPDCPLFKNEPCGNIPLSEDREEDNEEDNEEDEPESQDVCGFSTLQIKPFSAPERCNKGAFSIDSTNLWKDFEELGISKIYEPVAPNYATYASRIKTFEKWRSHDIQSPESLAEAGFYYIGHEDNVLCFHCGGGLKNWEKGEDPWVEHTRWFSKCRFIYLQKGRDFINQVLLNKKTYLTAETAREIMNERKKTERNTELIGVSTNHQSEPSTEKEKPSTSAVTVAQTGQDMPHPDSKEIQLCIICYTRERGIVFLPCGHFVCCPQCTSSLTKCAVCREPFKATVRAYLC